MTRKILVVEDDPATAAYLAKGLSEGGYAVETCGNGRDGLFLASEGVFDLIIADRMLPGLDGLAMLGAIRAAGIATPAIVLSALATVDDRIDGLRAGADDYLCKPYSFGELSARVEVLMRRADRSGGEGKQTRIVVGDLEIDLLARTVTRAGRPIALGRARIQPAGISRASCRAGRHPHDDAGEDLELPFRSGFECRRRAYRQAAPQAGGRFRRRDPAHGAGGGIPAGAAGLMRVSFTARLALLAITLALISSLASVFLIWDGTHNNAIEARCAAIDEPALVEQLDRLADVHEPRPGPWTRAKMDAGIFAKMLGGIRGFELEVTALRGTAKLSQNKTAADRIGVVRGLTAAGNGALAETMA